VLERRLREDQWVEFFEALFCTEHTRKIGYDFQNDLRVLVSSFPCMVPLVPRIKHLICLYKLLSRAMEIPDACSTIFNGAKVDFSLNLPDVANFFAKIEIDKHERIGNWAHRPLRQEQKKYAALDAFCLVKCFDIISERVLQLSDATYKAVQSASLITRVGKKETVYTIDPETGEHVKQQKSKETDEQFAERILEVSEEIQADGHEKTVDSLKLVMDSMLFGLGHALRKCGIETRLIEKREDIIKFCKRNPDYIAVSSGKGFKQLEIPLGNRVVNMPLNTNEPRPSSQLVCHLMRELKFVIKPEDLLSRCVKCNEKSFIYVPAPIIKAIFYMSALKYKKYEWLQITEENVAETLQELRDKATSTVESDEYVARRLGENDYTLYSKDDEIICQCANCAVDVRQKLMLPGGNGAPIDIGVGLNLSQESFCDGSMRYYVCGGCGKLQKTTYVIENR